MPRPEHRVSRVVEQPPSTAAARPPNTTLVIGPARLTIVFCDLVMNDVRTHTAPPGRPIPPIAMNSIGSTTDNTGCVYFNGLSVR